MNSGTTFGVNMPKKSKYGPRYLNVDFVNLKDHWALGLTYPIAGSNGNEYSVEIHEKGLTCDCMGMTMHGKCKHTRGVLDKWKVMCDEAIGD